MLEEFGGNVLSAEISAKKGTGIDALLEQILLQAEILDLKANPKARATARCSRPRSIRARVRSPRCWCRGARSDGGDNFICGMFSGRVRALSTSAARPVKEAGPAIPVQILGFEGVPAAGDTFAVVDDAVEAREIAQKRQRLEREAKSRRSQKGTSLEDFSRALKEGGVAALRIIIKADQGGPAEALADALAQLSTSEVQVDVVHRGVGAITESDMLLAKASGAIILGFHVRPDNNARAAAEREQVDVRTYRIIYEAVEDVRNALEGLLKPEERETVLGEAEVLQLFKVSKVGTIAGCMVRERHHPAHRQGARHARRHVGLRRHARQPQAVQGRRARGARRARVRHRHRELQRPQGRRPDRVVPDGGGQADPPAGGRWRGGGSRV